MPDEKQLVLLVEDDDVYRESIHRLLDNQYEVLDAVTGQDALSLLESQLPACVLLDFRLPDYTGLKLLPKLLERHLAVVMLTAEGNEKVAVDAMKQGCHDYLVKRDLTKDLLTRTVFNAIDRNHLQLQLATQRRELESFVATAAHDLQGPLRAIRGFSEFAEKAVIKGELEKLPEYLRIVQQSAARLAGMVEALLKYTRLEAQERRHEPVDLNQIVQWLLTEFQVTLAECGGRLEVGSLPTVQGDPQLLAQLFQNLIGNALKFRGAEPPIVTIDARQADEEWQISVSDNGIGMDPEHHERIFKPLHRLHAESKYTGYGIGLATCHRIMDKHAGRIRVESKPGQGATFVCLLPAFPGA